MGTKIQASAISANGATSSMALVTEAGEACIAKAGVAKEDIDILINIGLYHDDNIMEPAMAPLIQRQIGINTDPVKQNKMLKYTFCFDLYNGPCGFINALQVADTQLKTGNAKNVLIVSADTHPSKEPHPDFPFRPIGAAVLLSHEPKTDRGFQNFHLNTTDNGYHGFIGGSDITRWNRNGIVGKKQIEFEVQEGFIDALHEFSARSAKAYLAVYDITLDQIKFIITSQQEKGFAKRIHDGIGANGVTRVVDLHEQYGDPHSSALPMGLHKIMDEGGLRENETVLLAAAGSGLTAAFAMYKA